ncbi:MAG: hypothetical protein MRJ68_12265 [Nitrospira sp.]|nr:hypothetical protein [Nitrospira sp.]
MPTTPVMAVILSQAVSALWRGQVVAIKLVRVEQHIGSKEAKEQVEAYVHTQPTLGVGLSTLMRMREKDCFGG